SLECHHHWRAVAATEVIVRSLPSGEMDHVSVRLSFAPRTRHLVQVGTSSDPITWLIASAWPSICVGFSNDDPAIVEQRVSYQPSATIRGYDRSADAQCWQGATA